MAIYSEVRKMQQRNLDERQSFFGIISEKDASPMKAFGASAKNGESKEQQGDGEVRRHAKKTLSMKPKVGRRSSL